jgi:hypothetical protein
MLAVCNGQSQDVELTVVKSRKSYSNWGSWSLENKIRKMSGQSMKDLEREAEGIYS